MLSPTEVAMNRPDLPQLASLPFITDGGLETTLVFHDGIDLPSFAAFPLLLTQEGRDVLSRYFEPYFEVAARHRVGFVLDTPTWRANPDWARRLDYTAEELATINRDAVQFTRDLSSRHPEVPEVVLNGVVGPRGDGYVVGAAMSADQAEAYHLPQVRAFRDAGADMVSAITMTYTDEAIGIARAARSCGVPVAISFTVETDGRLPSGQMLRHSIEATDAATASYPAYYMINCAHPEHFRDALSSGPWLDRIRGIRANASRKSHAELDASTELDIGNPVELGDEYKQLTRCLKRLAVLGGCCGTDQRHVRAICEACLPQKDTA
jgi:S-methylmethionine-dependent homocysteine/selenocysteine methylase